ncbi:MAG: hypothetical protein HY743_09475 [Deltaproteobacteria bacterium]|nr:hypothetical protein [Deltaproteobacteria bacterium]
MTEKKLKKAEQALEMEQAKSRLLMELTRHIGKGRALGMAEAFEAAYPGRTWSNRINDTRAVRRLITKLRRGDKKKGVKPIPICSSCCNIRPGYYIPVGQEFEEWLKKREEKHLDGLGLVTLLRRISLPDFLGQKALAMRGGERC